MAALQSKHEYFIGGETQPHCSRNQVLYLVDINSSATDVANKLVQMYDSLSLDRNVIRFYTQRDGLIVRTTSGRIEALRQELHHRLERKEKGHDHDPNCGPLAKYSPLADDSEKIEFTQYVLLLSRFGLKSKAGNHGRDRANRVAPTLEEAVVNYYNKHKDTKYIELRNLYSIENGDLTTLKHYLSNQVYRDFIQLLDVIITTPVTASKFAPFLRQFNPKLIIFDEAPHARELSFLIPISQFHPRAWIFTGDHRQVCLVEDVPVARLMSPGPWSCSDVLHGLRDSAKAD